MPTRKFTDYANSGLIESIYLGGIESSNKVITFAELAASETLEIGNITNTSDTVVDILADDLYTAQLRIMGSSQGTGKLYVGQSTDYGGGLLYNGDDNPDIPSTSDNISFYRRIADVDIEVFRYPHSSNDVYFNGYLKPGTPTWYQTIYVPAGAMYARSSGGTTFNATEIDIYRTEGTMDFSDSTDNHCSFSIKMPKSWNLGNISCSLTWSHKTTQTAGIVCYFRAVALPNSGALTTGFGTAILITDIGGTGNDIYFTPYYDLTVGGTPAVDEYVRFDIYRDVSQGADTLTADMRLHGITLKYAVNNMADT